MGDGGSTADLGAVLPAVPSGTEVNAAANASPAGRPRPAGYSQLRGALGRPYAWAQTGASLPLQGPAVPVLQPVGPERLLLFAV